MDKKKKSKLSNLAFVGLLGVNLGNGAYSFYNMDVTNYKKNSISFAVSCVAANLCVMAWSGENKSDKPDDKDDKNNKDEVAK